MQCESVCVCVCGRARPSWTRLANRRVRINVWSEREQDGSSICAAGEMETGRRPPLQGAACRRAPLSLLSTQPPSLRYRFGVFGTPPSFLLDIVQCVVSFRSLWQLFHCRRGGGSPSLSLPHLISSLVSFDPPPTALDTASIALIIIGLCSHFLLPRPLLLRSCFMCPLPSFFALSSPPYHHILIYAAPLLCRHGALVGVVKEHTQYTDLVCVCS